jgi:hypothetical protein
MRALLPALVVAWATGCQCFVPVDEDAGADAGRPECTRAADCAGSAPACDFARRSDCPCGLVRRCEASRCATVENACLVPVDAGSECATPSDCAGAAVPVISFCGGATGAWSCAFGRCVVECAPGARTCASPDAGCLACDGRTACAPVSGFDCPLMTHLSVEQSTCPAFDTTAWLRTTRVAAPPCTATLEGPDGGVAGTLTFVSADELFADLPAAGGGCVGRALPTGALRYSLSCPGCMLSVRPEIVGP